MDSMLRPLYTKFVWEVNADVVTVLREFHSLTLNGQNQAMFSMRK